MRDTQTSPKYLLTITEAAHQLGVSPWTVRDWLRQGKLAAVKVGRSKKAPVRIKASDLDALLIPYVPGRSRSRAGGHDNETAPAGDPKPEPDGNPEPPPPGQDAPAPPDNPPPARDHTD
ncbi:helix-turn-helix domain-containing protein [Mycolicibacterium pulveris]|uniref:helix-turn-helix domain-containing protein n=1 Tax=Mycolicibacterium pulveris TaxID=36813 RepID=UPI003CF68B69